jgi:cardiolipin synthase
MNIPNSLTILRILLIPVFIGFMTYRQYGYALAALFCAGITDALDGLVARMTNQQTKLGEILDPLADNSCSPRLFSRWPPFTWCHHGLSYWW